MTKNKGGFVLGAIIGGAAAAITALLFAPKPGKELRDDITEEVNNLLDTARDYADIAVEKSNEFMDVAKETTEDIKINLKDTTSSIKTQFSETTKHVGEDLKKAKD
ncbi:MAG: YtxH domain-containing protein, partial [Trichococcus flocculiformis]